MAVFSKLKNAVILALAGVKFVFDGRADKKSKPHKILVIQTAKLGDMVCTTPMFRAVKEKYPQSALYVMGGVINGELLKGNLDINFYMICEKNFGFRDFLSKIKKENFDFACITSPNFAALAALYIAGIPQISAPVIKNGFSPYETKSYRILKSFVIAKPHLMGGYAPREYLRLLEPIGVFTENTKKHLYFSGEAEKKVFDFFTVNGINNSDFLVGIAPSAGNKVKRWGRNKFAELANYIFDKYSAKIIIIGSQSDKSETREMISFLNPHTKAVDSVGGFSIEELKALVSKLNLFISVDTGVIYIAEAFGVPTIDITGPIDEKEQPPIGEYHYVVTPPERIRPQLYVMNARLYNEKEALRQAESITIEMVVKVFEELYQKLRSKKDV